MHCELPSRAAGKSPANPHRPRRILLKFACSLNGHEQRNAALSGENPGRCSGISTFFMVLLLASHQLLSKASGYDEGHSPVISGPIGPEDKNLIHPWAAGATSK